MTLADFKIGERIVYLLRDGVELPGSVINVAKKRLVIVLDRCPNHSRNTTPEHVRKV